MEHTVQQQLIFLLFFAFGLMCTPLLFIALDLWSGIRKAKVRGERIRSNKLQRTFQKMSRYYNAVLAMFALDIIQIAGFVFLHIFAGWELHTFPVCTAIGVIGVAVIEIKSILEPADQKESCELREVKELAEAIANHKNDPKEIASAIAEYLKDKKD